jgi:hypothetical protein
MTKPAAVRYLLLLAVALWPVNGLATGSALAAQQGVPAPARVTKELQAALAQVVERFEARDVAGVLTRVSDQYRTGPLTKSGLRDQLIAIYSIYDVVRARIRIDDIRMVDGHAWVYSTGEVSGQLPLVGTWVVFLSWQHELEVARREPGQWRLFGYQQ